FALQAMQPSNQNVLTRETRSAAAPTALPDGTAATILVGSFSLEDRTSAAAIAALTARLKASGYEVYYAQVDLRVRGKWLRVLAGAFDDAETARLEASRLSAAISGSSVYPVSAGLATGIQP